MPTYQVIDYHTKKILADNIPTEADAKTIRNNLRKAKVLNDHDYVNYNWLLVIYED